MLHFSKPFIQYWDKILPDVFSVLLYAFFLEPLVTWQMQHPGLSCTILMLLNTLAVSAGALSFFGLYGDTRLLYQYRDSMKSWEGAALGMSVMLSAVGFFWWLFPFQALKKLGVTETGFILGMTFYFICFMSVVAKSVNGKEVLTLAQKPLVRASSAVFTTLFFFFSYGLLTITMKVLHTDSIHTAAWGLICLLVFYLPLRFFILLRPPRHIFEYVSFLLSFGYLLWQIFSH
ncbi:MAG: hypothetical protein IPP93_03440 [Chitinophagaceae bacterium]|nr:hypothetical protein [Chitinophagaceae bacterium]MBL0334432.1 hypothetical protein [Chitinophagaceae bacterium]